MLLVTTWRDLEDTLLVEISQTEKHNIRHLYLHAESKKQTYNKTDQIQQTN